MSSAPNSPASSPASSAPSSPDGTLIDPVLELELAELIVQALNLEQVAAQVDPLAPIYGEGLGLDSIDILEIALVVSKKYGFQLRSDDERNVTIFSSLRSLAQHVAAHRSK
jgi:acyl carrier protein